MRRESESGLDRRAALAAVSGAVLSGCGGSRQDSGPRVEFTRIPMADPGGQEKQDIIEGMVKGGRAGQQIVLYARSGRWWVQPLVAQPFTKVQGTGKWSNATHLGSEYAAILVEPGYRAAPVLDALPERGTPGVSGMAVTAGQKTPPSRTIPFSGYEWRVRDAPSDRGGKNNYASDNAWTDESGAMHLRIAKTETDWTCAEVTMNRSLGYGTYRFVVRDTGHLEPATVFGMFTWDYAGGEQGNREVDIELSQWGDPTSKNAQYVVQPYYVAANVARFNAPEGRLTHSFRWDRGRMEFRTMRGAVPAGGKGPLVAEHVFTAGVPTPGVETVRMNLYLFRKARQPLREPTEVVIEQFEYLP